MLRLQGEQDKILQELAFLRVERDSLYNLARRAEYYQENEVELGAEVLGMGVD